jgi:hypothetical protein
LVSLATALPAMAQTVPEDTVRLEKPSQDLFGGGVNFYSDVNIGTQRDAVLGFNGTVVQPEAGVEWRFCPDFSVTFGGNYNNLDGNKFNAGGFYDFRGETFYSGLSYYFADHFRLNVTGGYVHADISESTVESLETIYDKRPLNGGFVDTRLYAKYLVDQFRVEPLVEYLYYAGTEAASFNSDGSYRASDPDSLGRFSVGGDVYHGVNIGDFYFEPMAHALFDYDAKLLRGYYDRAALEVGGGVNIPVGRAGTTIALRDYVLTGRNDFRSNNVEIALYHQF